MNDDEHLRMVAQRAYGYAMSNQKPNQMTTDVLEAIKAIGQYPIGAFILLADHLAGSPENATTTINFTPGRIEIVTVEPHPSRARTEWAGPR